MSSFDKSAAIYRQTIRELNLGLYKDVISCPSSTSVAQGTDAEGLSSSVVYARKQEHLVDPRYERRRKNDHDLPTKRYL